MFSSQSWDKDLEVGMQILFLKQRPRFLLQEQAAAQAGIAQPSTCSAAAWALGTSVAAGPATSPCTHLPRPFLLVMKSTVLHS